MLLLYRTIMGKIDPKSCIAAKGGYYCMTCNRCNTVWYTKNKDIKTCTERTCRSPYWNKIRVR